MLKHAEQKKCLKVYNPIVLHSIPRIQVPSTSCCMHLPTSLLCTEHNHPPPPHPFSQKNPDQGPHAEYYTEKNVEPLVRLPAQRQELPAQLRGETGGTLEVQTYNI